MRDHYARYAYRGQVVLYPPKSCASEPGVAWYSASFGVVAVKQDRNNWMMFTADTPDDVTREDIHLLRSEADTVCRAAGFNDAVPNSAMTVQRAERVFNYTFDLPFM